MDPTANLEEQVRLAKRIGACGHDSELRAGQACVSCERNGARLAELVLALDRWIVRGGFLPDAWRTEAAPRKVPVRCSCHVGGWHYEDAP